MNAAVDHHTARRARRLARRHYENFPVGSLLLPRAYRAPVALFYAFARRADDLADEGTMSPAQRLAELETLQRKLDLARTGASCDDDRIDALAAAMVQFDLPWQPLYDLLTAFRQDVTVDRYADFAALADYCRRSANPVGRWLLHLYGAAEADNLQYSDAVCTALQLINFLQDVDADFQLRGRIYLPLDEMQRFGVDENDLRVRRNSPQLRALLEFQCRRAASLLEQGAPLGRALPGRFGRELRAIVSGGRRIVHKLQRRTDPFQRPRMRAGDWLAVAWGALGPWRG